MNHLRAITLLFILVISTTLSGQVNVDSLTQLLSTDLDDTTRIDILGDLSGALFGVEADQAIAYAKEASQLSEDIGDLRRQGAMLKNVGIGYFYKGDFIPVLEHWQASLAAYEALDDPTGVANLLSNIGAVYNSTGDNTKALEYFLKSLSIADKNNDEFRKGTVLQNIGVLYSNIEDYELSKDYYEQALEICKSLEYERGVATVSMNLSEVYMHFESYDKALVSATEAKSIFEETNDPSLSEALNRISLIRLEQNQLSDALEVALQSYELSAANDRKVFLQGANIIIGKIYAKTNKNRLAIERFAEAIDLGQVIGVNKDQRDAYEGLIEVYKKSGKFELASLAQDSLISVVKKIYDLEQDEDLSNLQLKYDLEKRESEITRLNAENALQEVQVSKARTSRNFFIALASLFLIGGFGLFTFLRNQRLEKKVAERTRELSESLDDLKSTQAQLIHAEKMASLGELTAGIAHEIQNPLNFVNNFSEVSTELIDEMGEEIEEGNMEDVMEISGMLKQNLEKINHHGKRADSIVKGMLQHSRTKDQIKTPTNINDLADEYLRLAFHGLRAKDKSFTADFETSFDESLPLVEVIPQDMSRVLLNLITNAFHACAAHAGPENDGFKPLVSVSTEKVRDNVLIKVKDNGTGIPESIREKIFQPFFTTKPTGQGTGLGLSMSYDIVTKGHGGQLTVDSEEGEGATFTITLPLK